eukprot:UN09046
MYRTTQGSNIVEIKYYVMINTSITSFL